jgi:AcrR family transcriptional regulator
MSTTGEPAAAPTSMVVRLADRRRRMAMAEITRVALELFAARSFAEVTVDDIAAAAGTSQRTFFRYFASKDDLLLQFRRRLDDRLQQALDDRPAEEGAVTALRRAYVATSTVPEAQRERTLMIGRILAASPTLRGGPDGGPAPGGHVAGVAARMGVDPSTDDRPAVVVAAMRGAAGAAFERWVAEGGRGDAGTRIDAALLLVAAGLETLDQVRPRRKGARRWT